MKAAKAIIAAILAACATVAGLDLNGFINVLPPTWAKWLVIIPSAAAILVHIGEAVQHSLETLDTTKP